MSYNGQPTHPRSNRILSAAPTEEYERLLPRLEYVELRRGLVLHEAGERMSHVYFPYSGTISVCVQMQDGDQTEVGVVGRGGMLGLPLVLGTDTAPLRAFTQVSGGAMRMRAADFAEEVSRRRVSTPCCCGTRRRSSSRRRSRRPATACTRWRGGSRSGC
jgi:CRP-like cAMP-binding protein